VHAIDAPVPAIELRDKADAYAGVIGTDVARARAAEVSESKEAPARS
jgi:hypothetical protein